LLAPGRIVAAIRQRVRRHGIGRAAPFDIQAGNLHAPIVSQPAFHLVRTTPGEIDVVLRPAHAVGVADDAQVMRLAALDQHRELGQTALRIRPQAVLVKIAQHVAGQIDQRALRGLRRAKVTLQYVQALTMRKRQSGLRRHDRSLSGSRRNRLREQQRTAAKTGRNLRAGGVVDVPHQEGAAVLTGDQQFRVWPGFSQSNISHRVIALDGNLRAGRELDVDDIVVAAQIQRLAAAAQRETAAVTADIDIGTAAAHVLGLPVAVQHQLIAGGCDRGVARHRRGDAAGGYHRAASRLIGARRRDNTVRSDLNGFAAGTRIERLPPPAALPVMVAVPPGEAAKRVTVLPWP
jgi:hypothetical protein